MNVVTTMVQHYGADAVIGAKAHLAAVASFIHLYGKSGRVIRLVCFIKDSPGSGATD